MNEFEKAMNDIESETYTGEVLQECCIEWLKNSKTATVTFPSNNKYNSKIRKLAKEYPDMVDIVVDNKDGSIVAHIPVKFIKINYAKRVLTSEQKEEMRERLRKVRENKE